MSIKGMPKFNKFCHFKNEFSNGLILVYKEDGTRSKPNQHMNKVILELSKKDIEVYAILDGTMSYDYLYYSFTNNETRKLNNRVKPRFEEGSDNILTSPAFIVNKKFSIEEFGTVRFTTIEKNDCIVSLRRFSVMEHWDKHTKEYMDKYKK